MARHLVRTGLDTHRFGAFAVGAIATGAFALGAVAVGALAIGRLAIGKARIRSLEIEELTVHRLRLAEPPAIAAAPPARDDILETGAMMPPQPEAASPRK